MELFYRKYGNGPPLFILHGLYGSSDNWVTIAKKLSGNFTVYLPDLRNHGQSPHSEMHDYNSMSMDLLELTEKLGIKKLFLAGHSMGGKVAAYFAVRWPERINSLVIFDISPFKPAFSERRFYDEHNKILESLLSVDPAKIRSRAEADVLFSDRIMSEKTRGFILKNLHRSSETGFSWKMNVESLYNNLEQIVGGLPHPTSETERVTGFPVTVVKGEMSDYLSQGEFDAIKVLFPSAEFVIIKDAGHWLHSEKPDDVTAILLKQLQD